MARQRRPKTLTEQIHDAIGAGPAAAAARIPRGGHNHVAEIYGESETVGLRPWARRAVLAGSRP